LIDRDKAPIHKQASKQFSNIYQEKNDLIFVIFVVILLFVVVIVS